MSNRKDHAAVLKKIIESGRFASQGRLPPERELAAEMGISRSTLRKALSALESQNIIWRQRGSGTFVGSRPDANGGLPVIGKDITNPAEIMVVRILLEPKIAAMAALHAKRSDLDEMAHCLQKSLNTTDTQTFELWDASLHFSIAKATGNLLLISIFRAVNGLRQDKIWGRLKNASVNAERRKLYTRQHREIIDAIRERDIEQSEKRMYSHLKTVQGHLLQNVEKHFL